MSDSRLEKFIYAICSMDVSDLPVPLSRIEKLWNCLITGEAPDFEPLSRNEKYLMAMLDRYDLNNLPAPVSRGEKLLYKIAIGETNLSDVPGYLSRYEELLKYLIENGGISGGDFEYVLYTFNQSLYTLYTTAEKPVKSAILKGQTLVNLLTRFMSSVGYLDDQYRIILNNVGNFNKITVVNKNSKPIRFSYYTNTWKHYEVPANGNISVDVPEEITTYNIFPLDTLGWESANYKSATDNIVLLHGDYANQDIPYFQGMQSVKMPVLTTTGKNLFDEKLKNNKDISVNTGVVLNGGRTIPINFISVEPNTSYTLTRPVAKGNVGIRYYSKSQGYLSSEAFMNYTGKFSATFTTPSNCYFIKFIDEADTLEKGYQIEQGTQATSYQPYQTNILTVNEDVTLRSNGSVCDELDLLTGKLTQRIDEDGEILTQEVVKTVDLTTVDQDNQPAQLGTFENVTHVSLEAENLIPTVEMEVATCISTELASASPLMDDISTKQEQLNTTVDEQSENVDATMIATTEIFEETL